jgi:hypothetical protein
VFIELRSVLIGLYSTRLAGMCKIISFSESSNNVYLANRGAGIGLPKLIIPAVKRNAIHAENHEVISFCVLFFNREYFLEL